MAAGRDNTDSGVSLYPRLPVPQAQRRDSAPPARKPSVGGKGRKKGFWLVAAGLVAGGALGFLLRPAVAPDGRVAELGQKVSTADAAAAAQKARADGLAAEVAAGKTAKAAVEKQLADAQAAQSALAGKAADAEAQARDAKAVEAKLLAAVDKGNGSVSAEGEEIHLQLVDKVLFKIGDDALTDQGKKVLDRVAAALKEIPDKQIWVQGHTDDQPIFNPSAVRVASKAPPKKGGRAGAAAAATVAAAASGAPGARFATNWELSAARALTVVHYLQDVAKLDPARLAALAFGQYRPVSKSNKALNRRIEIVLYPQRAIILR